MGTNYYLVREGCDYCGSDQERIPMCKISYGWKPLFISRHKFRSVSDYLNSGGTIEDERGDLISHKLFGDLIKVINVREDSKSHIILLDKIFVSCHIDQEGYEFTTGEFC